MRTIAILTLKNGSRKRFGRKEEEVDEEGKEEEEEAGKEGEEE